MIRNSLTGRLGLITNLIPVRFRNQIIQYVGGKDFVCRWKGSCVKDFGCGGVNLPGASRMVKCFVSVSK